MEEIDITPALLDKARQNSRYIVRNKSASIRGGDGAFIGSIGTAIVADYYGGSVVDSEQWTVAAYDMVIDGDKIEVKTKQRSVPPKHYYEASVTTQSLHVLDPDYFIFVSLLNLDKAFIMGPIEVIEFYDKATRLSAGDIDPSNNYVVRKDCLNIAYSELGDYDKVATA